MQNLILHPTEPVSNRIAMEKWLKYSKYWVFGQISRYFLSGFAIGLGLFLKELGLGAEFNSASNPTSFERDHNGKVAQILEKLSFFTDFEVFHVHLRYKTWVISLETWVTWIIQFCIQPNEFRKGSQWKIGQILEILSFWTDFEVFPVGIRYRTWIITKRTWVRYII